MLETEVEQSVITKGRYKYVHDVSKGPPQVIDVHCIIVGQSRAGVLVLCKLGLVAITWLMILILLQDKSVAGVFGSLILAAVLVRQFLKKQVEKETVIIFPSFGVQLEITYTSGRTVRRFVPIGKVLKLVLNECVTPVTCYWSLSLIIRGEEQLLLVFKELYPPVAMLVPIWKALCAAIGDKECTDTSLTQSGRDNR